MTSYTVPTVVERTPQGERAYDVFSRLLAERIVFLGTPIDDGVANTVIAQLFHLEAESTDREISLYLNSPGGSPTALMAIYDTLQFVAAPVSTWCVGQARRPPRCCSRRGTRGAASSSSTPASCSGSPRPGGTQGTVSDLTLQAAEMQRIRSQVEEVLARHVPHSPERLRADMDRDRVFTAQEAVDYGLADLVVTRRLPPA